MKNILLPSNVGERLRNAEPLRAMFFDEQGNRIAKMAGLAASVAALDTVAADDRAVDFVISSGALDRYNSTIAVDGWKIDNYTRNPVILWAHDDSIPAIGRADTVRIDSGALKSRAVFAGRDVHPLADTIYQLVRGKFINAASVGWIPLEYKFVEGGDRGFGVDYLEQELLEWSVVNVPANPECLVGARSMGIDTHPLLTWAERALDQGGMLMIPRTELEALRRAAGAATISPPARRADAAEWKCGAARDLPIAEQDSWDGPAAAKRILDAAGFDGDSPDSAKARRGFLVYDAANPSLRGSYKLPFADIVGGELKASAAGIRAAASRLPQTDAPQSVKDEARAVLDHYEAKMGSDDKTADLRRLAVDLVASNAVPGITDESAFDLLRVIRSLLTAPAQRAGRVLSAENERRLRSAHDCMQDACEHVMAVIGANEGDPAGDDGGDGDDPDEDAARDAGDDDGDEEAARSARARRQRRARVLMLSASPAALTTSNS